MIDEFKKTFREEAFDLLAGLESALLELERTPDNREDLDKVFRVMHTIKGSGNMFGFDDVAAFTHDLETAFDLIRNGKGKVSKELIDLTLLARDQIKNMIESVFTGEPADEKQREFLTCSIRRMFGKDLLEAGVKGKKAPAKPPVPVQALANAFRIRFKPHQNLFLTGTNPVFLLEELRAMGDASVLAFFENVPPLSELNPEFCYLSWEVLLHTPQNVQAVRDVFIFVEDDCDIKIEAIDAIDDPSRDTEKIGEIMVNRGDVSAAEVERMLQEKKPLGEMLIENGMVSPEQVEVALQEQQFIQAQKKKRIQSDTASGIRVASERLDHLVNLIGELVTIQARLTQTSSRKNDPEFIAISEVLERLTAELRDSALNIRMLPIGSTFGKFRRMVRDLSRELNREIELTAEGEETELDKTVIEKLNDPLVHLIRNSIDHGIETPEERVGMGKPRVGQITLSAFHSGANVIIEIRDDGRGLNREAIKEQAVLKGLLAPNTEITDKDLFALIFLPGFSTARKVTSVSGRGVGMDVVKRAIEELRGQVEIGSRSEGGTKITIRLPLTLAIINGLLVKISDRYFVIPLSSVQECVELKREDIARANGKNVAIVRGQMVPYIRLRDRFVIDGACPDIEQIVITEIEGLRVGFVVDHVVGEHQTVIKTLGRMYRDVGELSGATILGDGSVALILDIAKFVHLLEQEESERIQPH
jgi:two-component system chemotaxis sensor kinase CheA